MESQTTYGQFQFTMENMDTVMPELGRLRDHLSESDYNQVRIDLMAAYAKLGAQITHDLRGIVCVMAGEIDLIDRLAGKADLTEELKAEFRRCTDSMRLSMHYAQNMVDDYRELCWEMPDENRTGESLLDVVKAALAWVRKEFARVDGAAPILIGLTGDAGLVVSCSRDNLVRAFHNLINNAWESFQGLKEPLEREGRIDIAVAPCEVGATVTIADNGPGMTQKMLEGLNGGFPIGSIRKRRGLGLGAYIARHKIAAHGGSIVYESRQGIGTTATVTLPVKQEAAL